MVEGTPASRVRYGLAIVVVGALGAAFAVLYRLAVHAVFARGYGRPNVLVLFQRLPPWLCIALPAAGGLLAGVVGVIAARRAGGHGVAEILEAVALGRGRISIRTASWKALGSFVAIVSGGSIGREGPLVQFGAAAGGLVGQHAKLDPKRIRALVAAGTAAGFAAAYNTPLAAVLFVIEVVTGLAALDVVMPVVVATTVATALTRMTVGGGPIYGLRVFTLRSETELVAFAFLGLAAGIVGPGFMAMLGAGEQLFQRIRVPRPVKGAIGGAIVGAIAIKLPEVTGNGYEEIQRMLESPLPLVLFLLLLSAKSVATTASVSSGSPGGVFTPSLFLGAALGGAIGTIVVHLVPGHQASAVGGYALVGMAAVVAATTHAPLMAAVLVFELSGDYAVVLPLMLATTIATLVARRLRVDSVYTEELRRRGIPWEGTLAERLARAVRAKDILEMDPPCVSETSPTADALALLRKPGTRVVYVIGSAVKAIDLHAANEVWRARAEGRTDDVPLTAGELASTVTTASPDDTLLILSEKLWGIDWGEVPVVDPANPGLVLGVVTRRAVLGAFDRELLQRDILFTRVVWSDGQHELADYIELPPGQRVEIIKPADAWTGRSVEPGEVRKRFHVTVFAVRHEARARGEAQAWSDPQIDQRVQPGDRWMVIGRPEDIERLRHAPASTQPAGAGTAL